jgi:hypothetical protein
MIPQQLRRLLRPINADQFANAAGGYKDPIFLVGLFPYFIGDVETRSRSNKTLDVRR